MLLLSANQIDTSCLEGLGEDELKILIPENRLRDRIKFKLGYKKYSEELETVHSVSMVPINVNIKIPYLCSASSI